jgi:hypothetical protein
MGRGRCAFKQSDLVRAVKAVRKAGVEVARVEIDNGKIVVIAGKPTDALGRNELDKWLAEHARQA